MGIEALYPYIAVAYGTFGIVFGVILWWKTQRRIDRTKTAIEIQVANAVTDIGSKVDAKLGTFDGLAAKIDALEDTEIDYSGLDERLDKLMQDLPDEIGKHLEMHYRSIQAQEAKQIGKMVEQLGVEGISEEMRAVVTETLSVGQKATIGLMKMKIPKSTWESHPLSATVFDNSRAEIAQGIGQIMDKILNKGEAGTAEVIDNRRGGFGVR